jgi:hypothetical protein
MFTIKNHIYSPLKSIIMMNNLITHCSACLTAAGKNHRCTHPKTMVFLLVTLFHLCTAQMAFSQWVENSTTHEITFNEGNAGLGTTNPSRLMHLRFDNSNITTSQLYLEQDGTGDAFMQFGLTSGRHFAMGIDNSDSDLFKIGTSSTTPNGVHTGTLLSIASTGQVRIGTTTVPAGSTGHRLAVRGSILAEEVRVLLFANWPDYVFAPDYKLMPLKELEAYISQNQRLPEIPSAEQVAREGFDLGNMNRLLTKKVEELTLYLLQQNQQMEVLMMRIEQLELEAAQRE